MPTLFCLTLNTAGPIYMYLLSVVIRSVFLLFHAIKKSKSSACERNLALQEEQ